MDSVFQERWESNNRPNACFYYFGTSELWYWSYHPPHIFCGFVPLYPFNYSRRLEFRNFFCPCFLCFRNSFLVHTSLLLWLQTFRQKGGFGHKITNDSKYKEIRYSNGLIIIFINWKGSHWWDLKYLSLGYIVIAATSGWTITFQPSYSYKPTLRKTL